MEALSRAAASCVRIPASLQRQHRPAPRAAPPRCSPSVLGSAVLAPPALLRRAFSGVASRHGRPRFAAAAAAAPSAAPAAPAASPALQDWLVARGLPPCAVAPGPAGGLVTTRAVAPGEVMLELPDSFAVTATDVAAHPRVARLAEGRGELVGLALWLIAERDCGAASEWAPFLATLPRTTLTPMLWPAEQRAALLKGSAAQSGAEERAAALAAEWASLGASLSLDPAAYPPAVWNERAFGDALAVVLATAVLLPAAECFALLPLAGSVRRRAPGPLGDGVTALLDYDAGRGAVVLLAQAPHAAGAPVVAADTQGRANADLLLSAGEVDADFPGDFLTWSASLVAADRLFAAKAAALQAAGLAAEAQTFPVYADRFPTQLLAYLRLSRLTDIAEMAKVRFEADAMVSQVNEYEVLQLMLGDCRERLAAYSGGLEEDMKLLQGGELSPQEYAAAALRLAEKRILTETMAAVRRRLAPIRGIPTKSGRMDVPNSDILEIFEQLENLNKAPRAMFNSMFGWDDDGNIKPPKSGCS